MRLYTDYGKIYNDVITNISTNTTPNVCITYPDHIATYMTGDNVVVPLDSLMTDARYGLAGSELKFDGPSTLQRRDRPAVPAGVHDWRHDLCNALYAFHGSLLCEQNFRGEAGV